MASFSIPNAGLIRQLNLGSGQGEIVESYQIDLHTKPGKILLARPMKRIATDAELGSDIVEALVFGDLAFTTDTVFALTDSNLYGASSASDYETFALESNLPASAHDAAIYRNELIITTHQNLDAYDGNDYDQDWWTAEDNYTSAYALPSQTTVPAAPIILENVRIGEETLAVTAGSKVHAFTGDRGLSGGDAGVFTSVDLDDAFTACCIKSGIRKVFIGTYSNTGEDAFVYQWDGASTNYDEAFPIGAKAALAMELYENTPVIITERGEIKIFNNAGFKTIGQFPFTFEPYFSQDFTSTFNNTRPIHPKGVKVIGNKMQIYVNFKEASDHLDNRTHSGVWVFDFDTKSLTHLASPDGEQVLSRSGPILVLDDADGRIFIGTDRDVAGGDVGIYKEDLDPDTISYGHLTTVEVESEMILDNFKEEVIKALLGEGDELVVKYRVSNDVSLPIIASDASWLLPTQINSTADLSRVLERFDAGERDEVEIVKGYGAGRLAHITNVRHVGSVYEIEIDEEIGVTGELSDIRIDNWTKINLMTATDGEKKRFGIGKDSGWCQVRVGVKGKNGRPEIRKMLLNSNPKES